LGIPTLYYFWLVVSSPLKNSQIGSSSQLLGKIKAMFQTTKQLSICAKKNSPGLEKNKKLIQSWLVVLTILKNISQWGGLSHILWKIKNVPNHQPESVMFITAVPVDWVLRSATVNTIWWNTPDEMFPGSSQIIPRSSRKSAFKLKKHQSLASGKRLQQNYVFFVGN